MDASLYTARRRAVEVYTNARDLAPFKGARVDASAGTKRMGEVLNLLVEGAGRGSTPAPPPAGPIVALPSAIPLVDTALDAIMRYIQTLNPGPTRASRIIYTWFFSVTAAYNWVSPTAHACIGSGVRDGWNWGTRRVIPANLANNIYSWVTYALTQFMPVFISGYDATPLLAAERAALRITAAQQTRRHAVVHGLGQWATFWMTWQAWYATRTGDSDGAVSAAIPPAAVDLPNNTAVLDTAATVDPATFPQPHAWTPLQVGPKVQKYLTYNWNAVRSSCLTEGDEAGIKSAAAAHIVRGDARIAELDEVVFITNNLSDTQKMIAEFWAGGPGSVSPPCIAVVMWNLFMRAQGATRLVTYDTYFFSGLDMCIHVFEAGRLIWGLKKAHMQARPIQEIRAAYRGQAVKNGFGEVVLGEAWTPFQEAHFVTPPFADFPSGHSGFSQVFADVMTKWFGATIPDTVRITGCDLSLISPVLASTTSLEFPTFIMPAGGSLIQPRGAAAVPAADVTLTWTRWQDMADSAGISRKYGGIHAASAHTGSQALGRVLHSRIEKLWRIIV
jgi:hypothetical protein